MYKEHLEQAGPDFLQGLIGQIQKHIKVRIEGCGLGPPAPLATSAIINMGNTAARTAAMKAKLNEPIAPISLVRIVDCMIINWSIF